MKRVVLNSGNVVLNISANTYYYCFKLPLGKPIE